MKEVVLIIDENDDDIRNFQDYVLELDGDVIVESEKDLSQTISKIRQINQRGDKVLCIFTAIIFRGNNEFKALGLDIISAVKETFGEDIFLVAYTQYGIDYITKAYERGANWHVRKQYLRDLTLTNLRDKIDKHNIVRKVHSIKPSQTKGISHVFISYVRENTEIVDRLQGELRTHGINVWLDRTDLKPGLRWKDAIKKAISEGAFFIACFSTEYHDRSKTYMNEELTLAVEELRLRPKDRAWFIPVLLSDCKIPDRNIGGGETLSDIQAVKLYKDWHSGIQLLLSAVQSH